MERLASQQNQNIGVIADHISKYSTTNNGESSKKPLPKKSNVTATVSENRWRGQSSVCLTLTGGLPALPIGFRREGGDDLLLAGDANALHQNMISRIRPDLFEQWRHCQINKMERMLYVCH